MKPQEVIQSILHIQEFRFEESQELEGFEKQFAASLRWSSLLESFPDTCIKKKHQNFSTLKYNHLVKVFAGYHTSSDIH